MKRILYIAIALAATAASCTGSKDASPQEDNTARVIVPDTFVSPDLTFADLRGKVSKCKVTSTEMTLSSDTLAVDPEGLSTVQSLVFDDNGYICQVTTEDFFMGQPMGASVFTFEFDSIGKLVSSANSQQGRFNVKRNKAGLVTTFTCIGSGGDVDYTKLYTWTDGKLVSERMANDIQRTYDDGTPMIMPIDNIKYTYDDEGYQLTKAEESGDPQLQLNITETTYDYTDRDDHGNWTSRNVTSVAKVYKIGPSSRRTLTDSVATYLRQTREIDY